MLAPTPIFGMTFVSCIPVPGFPVGETTLLERADVGCVLINSAVEGSVVAPILDSAGFTVPLEPGAVSGDGVNRVLWLTPRSWLVLCAAADERKIAAHISTTFPDRSVHAATFTDCLCWLELSGPEARTLLAESGFVSLEAEGLRSGRVKRTSLAGITAIVLPGRSTEWLIGVDRSLARYMTDWLRASARKRAG